MSGNSSSDSGGGGIANIGTATITNSTISGNSAGDPGGGIANGGTFTIDNSTISGNSTSSSGGGIANGGTLTITNSTISGNSASGSFGGGVYNLGGDLTITDSTISANSVNGRGGGIWTNSSIEISKSTISGNSSSEGGGIYNSSLGSTITNSTISGNSGTARGGGIYNAHTLYTSFVTIAKNSSPDGSGIYFQNFSTKLYINNSIIADNIGSPNCNISDTIYASDVNFATDGSCGSGFTQVTLSQLNLQPLADNGGPTPTHALGPGSVAIDAASECTDLRNNPVTTDQRGVTRPQGARCDAGAFEREAAGYRLYLPLVVKGP